MIAIVTDSTAYLTATEARTFGVRVVPIAYAVSGKQYSEKYIDQNGDFISLISSGGEASTSQASVTAFSAVFKELAKQGFEILCIVMSSRLSGIYSSASIAAKEAGKAKIVVVDSQTTAGGLAMLVKRARTLIDEGLSLKQTAEKLMVLREKVGIAFSVDDMEALRKSGRIGMVRQSIGTILNVRPILMLEDGAVVSCGIARGKADQIRKIIEKIPEEAREIIIHYITQQSLAASLFSAARRKFPLAVMKLAQLGPVLGIHLGTGVVAAAWIKD